MPPYTVTTLYCTVLYCTVLYYTVVLSPVPSHALHSTPLHSAPGYDFFPHTVTFNGTGDLINGQVISYPQGDSRTTFDGVGVANSGELIIPASAAAYGSPARYPTTYTLTFTTAGTYRYKCLLHDSIGMIGYVVVSL
jgi:plastocyanin